MQSGVIKLCRSLVGLFFTEPQWILLNGTIQFEQVLFTCYCSEIPNLSANGGAFTAFLLDGNINPSVFALNHKSARKIRTFMHSGDCLCWWPWCVIPSQARTDTKYSRGKCDQLL